MRSLPVCMLRAETLNIIFVVEIYQESEWREGPNTVGQYRFRIFYLWALPALRGPGDLCLLKTAWWFAGPLLILRECMQNWNNRIKLKWECVDHQSCIWTLIFFVVFFSLNNFDWLLFFLDEWYSFVWFSFLLFFSVMPQQSPLLVSKNLKKSSLYSLQSFLAKTIIWNNKLNEHTV